MQKCVIVLIEDVHAACKFDCILKRPYISWVPIINAAHKKSLPKWQAFVSIAEAYSANATCVPDKIARLASNSAAISAPPIKCTGLPKAVNAACKSRLGS